jgi:hypothetical protein
LYLGSNGTNDNHGIYAACMDDPKGFAYFAATYVYKIDVRGALPVQVGNGVSLSRQASFGTVDSAAGCAYFSAGSSLYQIAANGTNPPTPTSVMSSPFGSSVFCGHLFVDATDPANHYLYVMTETGLTNSTLFKLALNQFPGTNAIIGSASVNPGEPALYYGAVDASNRFAYYGTFVTVGNQLPYLVKFSLGNGANPPARVGALQLDTTVRSVGGVALDPANGYGYCASDDSDLTLGQARVYKWALNGTNAPLLVSSVDFHTNEGYCHTAFIKPERGLLYFASDLSYPGKVHRFRLPPGTNAPVETGTLFCASVTNLTLPAWGTNPSSNAYWGEVFLHCIAYDSVRDFVYFGRDHADGQAGFYTNEIIKTALDRDEMLVSLAEDTASTNNTLPYRESFESYSNGFSLVGTSGWSGEDAAMGLISTNPDSYPGVYPLSGAHQRLLQVDGAVTNRFRPSLTTNVVMDCVLQGNCWTDPLLPALSATPFALCVTTNGRLAVWNCTNPPASGNGWTELADTSIASNQFFRVTVQAAYDDANGRPNYRLWVNGAPSLTPRAWYAAADTNQSCFGDFVARGHFELDDLVVTASGVAITNLTRNPDSSVSLSFTGLPGLTHRVWATTNLAMPAAWQPISTNTAGPDGSWQVLDSAAAGRPWRFYRASLP